PLTSNGKVDRKALPMPEDMGIDTGVEYVSPQTSTEKILAKIWGDVLSLDADSIGIHDHFFDLGGSSLKIMKALELIKATFKKEIKVSILFEHSNIESLAIYINNSFEEIQIEDDFDRDDLLNDLYKLNRDVF
ncbi:phosphopantetheine-binding protein, partial [Chryseobacterium sp. JV558]|uniref:phosphopantetheine-binding protein n=1 Tax=Chryseobacterium sp. JV558 TaxID=2663236 RepID=UPI00299F14BD